MYFRNDGFLDIRFSASASRIKGVLWVSTLCKSVERIVRERGVTESPQHATMQSAFFSEESKSSAAFSSVYAVIIASGKPT